MKRRISALLLFTILMLCMTGCSRATMNAQIAESIGTLGMYENNEPVETPKMKAQREIQEQKEAVEEDVTGHLEKAARMAASYNYTEALEELALISEEHADDDRVISAKIEYQRLLGQMDVYSGDIAHISVKTLAVDPQRAFEDEDMGYYYNYWTLTVDEFKAILQSLYDRGYVLMDVHETVVEVQNEDGTTSFAVNTPSIPEGKTPMVLSFTEANYYDYQQGDGFSGRMVLDEDGNVMNEYTDASGQTLVGAYDVVPIVDEFVEEHPDFSLRGAKGIISVTGYEGVFGYGIETGAGTIAAIADRLKETGWQIACQGFSDNAMESDLELNELEDDLDAWSNKIGSLVGDTDLLVYPYGEEVTAGTARYEMLLEKGYHFFFSIWTTADFIEVQPDYVRQSRRTLDGYDLYMYADYLTDFFDADEILDETRPPFE